MRAGPPPRTRDEHHYPRTELYDGDLDLILTETRDDLLAIKGLAERVPDEEGALALVAPRAIARLASHARARIEFVSP